MLLKIWSKFWKWWHGRTITDPIERRLYEAAADSEIDRTISEAQKPDQPPAQKKEQFSLSEGLLLEDSQTLLKWGISHEEAWGTAKPMHYLKEDDNSRIKWEENILGGMYCGVLAYLPDGETLKKISIWRIFPENTYPRGAWYSYMTFFNHFLDEIGRPDMTCTKGSAYYAPILKWNYQGCTLTLSTGERFGDFTSLAIEKI